MKMYLIYIELWSVVGKKINVEHVISQTYVKNRIIAIFIICCNNKCPFIVMILCNCYTVVGSG